ncbi:hypothetical protein CEXT_30611 [Caerostris extrusa]|uniref:Uncharacterized protein n=1 Tax=Caerostris extrusa TaxID=172846 RepID=A0AAV4S3G4_CAEEX|nr:hypothetical protein CEXT_30611 [Caerostris extrusa]
MALITSLFGVSNHHVVVFCSRNCEIVMEEIVMVVLDQKVPDFRFIRYSVFSISFAFRVESCSYLERKFHFRFIRTRLTVIPGGAQPARPASAQHPLIPQQLHRVYCGGRIPGHGGSDALRLLHNRLTHLPQTCSNHGRIFIRWRCLTTNCCMWISSSSEPTPESVISLNHNNLTDLDSVLHPGMYNVDQLDLSHNPFTRVTENSFNGKVNRATYIGLDNCLIQEFNVRHYMGLPRLFRLELKYNLIDKIINIYEANYTDDYIKEFNIHRLQAYTVVRHMRTLHQPIQSVFSVSEHVKNSSYTHYKNSYNRKTKYPYYDESDIEVFYGQISHLSMTGNRIPMLRSEDFSQLVELRSLMLRNNDIGQVDGNIFTFFSNSLILLDLSQNKIHSLQWAACTLPVRTHVTQSRR